MPDFFLPRALLPSGWARRVLISTDADGRIQTLESDARPSPGSDTLAGVAIPGIPNVHSHAFQRAMAGLTESKAADRDSFWSWRERMYAFLARLSPADVEVVASQLYVEMLKAGYTSVVEFHYLHHDPSGRPYGDPAEMSWRLLAAAELAGIGLTLCPTIYLASDFGGAPLQQSQARFRLSPETARDLLERLRSRFPEDGGVWARRLGLALHSLRAVPPHALAESLQVADRLGANAPIHIHVAEQMHEVGACLTWSGARPIDWLMDHAPVNARWCLVHATHGTSVELARVARSGATVALCPTTEANLGDGVFPLRQHLESDGAFGIGSDSHVSVSPVEELRWLEYGQRLTSGARNVSAGFPHASTGRTLLEHGLAGGARATGTRVGALEVGAMADWIVLDGDHPVLTGREDDLLIDSWVFAGDPSAVREVVVGGRVVVRDGRHPREDEVLERYRRAIRRLLP